MNTLTWLTLPLALTCFAGATVLHNQATGALPSFSTIYNVPPDPFQDTAATGGDEIDIDITTLSPGVTFQYYNVPAKYFKCVDLGYCLCDAATAPTAALTGIGDDGATGQEITGIGGGGCVIAPYTQYRDGVNDDFQMAARVVNGTQHQHDLDRIQAEVNQALDQKYDTWVPTDALVVTWKQSDGATPPTTNSFQAVLATDGTDTYVLYLYDELLRSTNAAGFVRGFGFDGTANTHRICNSVAGSYDDPLADNELPLNSNWKCGNPGVYVFSTTNAADSCPSASAATSCTTSLTVNNPNCNVTSVPQDTCTATFHCYRNDTDPNYAHLLISFKWYVHRWVQALNHTAFMGAGATPAYIQSFVGDHAGKLCGKELADPASSDSDYIEYVLPLAAGSTAEDQCGFSVDAATGEIGFAVKLYDWNGTAAGALTFGSNSIFDSPGDLMVYGTCDLDDLNPNVTVQMELNDASPPTQVPYVNVSATFEAVNQESDTDGITMSYAQIGQTYYLRICYDRGDVYTKNAHPFAKYPIDCWVSNDANFPATAPPLFTYQFLSSSCSADPTQGPLFLARGFSVPDSYYLGSPRTYPRPFCTYSPAIIAHRYNTHNATNAKLDVLHFKCFTSQCTTLDGLSPRDLSTEEQKCYDNCLADDPVPWPPTGRKRRDTVPNRPSEVLYTSIRLVDPDETQGDDGKVERLAHCTDATFAIATIVTLIALVFLAVLMCILIFLKLVKMMKGQKMHSKRMN